uniref:Uncharacterized protein LOC104235435 n=1 Tax=Nicotiana sylvestris TaxID=4096 RepID=A0A1U7XKM7_NICSY|nr:PREDICTED: uncharacterized protein LOC104235435 [Nicotiana sylvestris]
MIREQLWAKCAKLEPKRTKIGKLKFAVPQAAPSPTCGARDRRLNKPALGTAPGAGLGVGDKEKKFLPPLSSLNQDGKPNFFMRAVRKDGRLELTEVNIGRPETLLAFGQDGRLRLHLIHDEEEETEEENEDFPLDDKEENHGLREVAGLSQICGGFGYDTSANDYKVVKIAQFYHFSGSSLVTVTMVYSLKLGLWKKKVQDCPYWLVKEDNDTFAS